MTRSRTFAPRCGAMKPRRVGAGRGRATMANIHLTRREIPMNEIDREITDEFPTRQILLWPKVTDENGERKADLSDIYAAFEELTAQLADLRDERDRLASATSLDSLDDAIDQLQSSWQKSGVTVPEMGLLIAGACKLRDYLRQLIESED